MGRQSTVLFNLGADGMFLKTTGHQLFSKLHPFAGCMSLLPIDPLYAEQTCITGLPVHRELAISSAQRYRFKKRKTVAERTVSCQPRSSVSCSIQQAHWTHEALDQGDSCLSFSACLPPVGLMLLDATNRQLKGRCSVQPDSQ